MRFILTLWIAKIAAFAVNLLDKKRGSNYAGKIAIKLMPDFVSHFKKIDYAKTANLYEQEDNYLTENAPRGCTRQGHKSRNARCCGRCEESIYKRDRGVVCRAYGT